jgi:hypothetical protein
MLIVASLLAEIVLRLVIVKGLLTAAPMTMRLSPSAVIRPALLTFCRIISTPMWSASIVPELMTLDSKSRVPSEALIKEFFKFVTAPWAVMLALSDARTMP